MGGIAKYQEVGGVLGLIRLMPLWWEELQSTRKWVVCWALFDWCCCDGGNHRVPGGRWCAGPYSIDAVVMGGTAKYQEVSSVLGLIRLMLLWWGGITGYQEVGGVLGLIQLMPLWWEELQSTRKWVVCWALFDWCCCDGGNHRVPGGRWCAGPYSIDAVVMGGTAKYQEVSSVLGLIRLMLLWWGESQGTRR